MYTLSLGDDPAMYMAYGADLRERVETSNAALLGLHYSRQNTYELHRLLLFADLHAEDFRVFVQLGDELETGRSQRRSLPTSTGAIWRKGFSIIKSRSTRIQSRLAWDGSK